LFISVERESWQVGLDFDYARKVIEAEGEAICAMVRIVDESFVAAAEIIFNCTGSVIVTGVGKAGIIGTKISATLASTGTPSLFLHPVEAVHGDLGRVGPGDVVLALSHSGQSDEIVRLVNLIKQQENKLISITGDAESRLARYSDVVLCMGMLEEVCPLGIAPSVSTVCMLAVGDALAFTVMKARNFSAEDYARFHPGGSLGAKLITVGQSMMFKAGEKLPLARMDDTIGGMLAGTEDIKRRGAVMIVDKAGKLAGIITDGDLRRGISERQAGFLDCSTADVMTADCKRVGEDTLAGEAMAIFHKYRIDELPVVDGEDRPVGLIDVQDIVAIKIVG
jgi:arabinose-5-phosphate isomerase